MSCIWMEISEIIKEDCGDKALPIIFFFLLFPFYFYFLSRYPVPDTRYLYMIYDYSDLPTSSIEAL